MREESRSLDEGYERGSSSSSMNQQQLVPVLILGGWSAGPLDYLKRGLVRNCIFLEPDIPMPPVGWSWCLDWSMMALVGVFSFMTWSCYAVASITKKRWLVICARIAIVVISLVMSRVCVAFLVRNAIEKGILRARWCLEGSHITVVIGFSWGGGVASELVRRGLIGGPGQPAVLLIAPTTSIISCIAMQRDPANVIRVEDSGRVQVVHGTLDQMFCPNQRRWEQTGATVVWCDDNHVFLHPRSKQRLAEILVQLLQNHSNF
jgi:hypothetical protein